MAGREAITEQRKEIVEKIISDMQEHGFEWVRPWSEHFMQRNAVSNRTYHGGNRLHLAFISQARGYDDPRWCTFNQAKENGWAVRKGAKSAVIEHWKTTSSLKPSEAEDGSDDKLVNYPVLVGAWHVFNAAEIEGIPPLGDLNANHISDDAATVIPTVRKSSRCKISEAERISQACYKPLADIIEMPAQPTFVSDESYLRTLLHEMAHSTGHHSALDRDMHGSFGSESYAFEELIAELGSIFTATQLGFPCANIDERHYQNHVAYLQSWVSALRNDEALLFRAASKADAACEYIIERIKTSEAEELLE